MSSAGSGVSKRASVGRWDEPFPLISVPPQAAFVNVTGTGFYPDTSPPNAVAVTDIVDYSVSPDFGSGLCVCGQPAPLRLSLVSLAALP